MNTLDILLCAGNGKLSKKIVWINKLTRKPKEARKLSHVVIAHSSVLVAESTTWNAWVGRSGYQVNNYDSWLRNYGGEVYLRRFTGKLPCAPWNLLGDLRTELRGRPYESGIPGYWELLKAGIGFGMLPPTNELHCSETVTIYLKRFGFIPEAIRDYAFAPADMWPDGKFDDYHECYANDVEQLK